MLHAKLRVLQKKFKWDRWLRGYEPWNCFLFVWQQKNHIQKERENINKARVDLVQHLRRLFTVLFSSYHSLSIQTLASCTLLLNVCFCHLFCFYFFSFTFSFFTRVYKWNIYLFEPSEIYVHMRENYTNYTLPFLVRWWLVLHVKKAEWMRSSSLSLWVFRFTDASGFILFFSKKMFFFIQEIKAKSFQKLNIYRKC